MAVSCQCGPQKCIMAFEKFFLFWVPMNIQKDWMARLESAYSFMLEYYKITVCLIYQLFIVFSICICTKQNRKSGVGIELVDTNSRLGANFFRIQGAKFAHLLNKEWEQSKNFQKWDPLLSFTISTTAATGKYHKKSDRNYNTCYQPSASFIITSAGCTLAPIIKTVNNRANYC